MLGDFGAGTASLGLDVLENRFVKGTDGIWRIREMRIFPIMATDYYQRLGEEPSGHASAGRIARARQACPGCGPPER